MGEHGSDDRNGRPTVTVTVTVSSAEAAWLVDVTDTATRTHRSRAAIPALGADPSGRPAVHRPGWTTADGAKARVATGARRTGVNPADVTLGRPVSHALQVSDPYRLLARLG